VVESGIVITEKQKAQFALGGGHSDAHTHTRDVTVVSFAMNLNAFTDRGSRSPNRG